jgi:hypothetical protein
MIADRANHRVIGDHPMNAPIGNRQSINGQVSIQSTSGAADAQEVRRTAVEVG